MADNVPVTGGSGFTIATDDVSGVQFQKMKLDVGGDGVSLPVVAGGANGLPVDLLSSPAGGLWTKPVAGQVWPINDNGGSLTIDDGGASLTIDAPVGTPVFVRLSDGTNPIATLPVSGTVTSNQGTAAAPAGGWPTKITDGTDVVGISSVSAARALKVDVIQSVTPGALSDEAAFTAGSTAVSPIAAVYNDSLGNPSSGQLAAVKMTQLRGLHVNLRAAAGTEIGSSAAPLRVDPVGTTAQPVNLFDNSSNPYTDANPLPVQLSAKGRTRVTVSVAVTASQTGGTVWTPTSSKRFNITSVQLTISVAGDLAIFDNTNSAANLLLNGVAAGLPIGRHSLNFQAFPWVSAAINNVLKYTSGSGLVGILTIHGFETT